MFRCSITLGSRSMGFLRHTRGSILGASRRRVEANLRRSAGRQSAPCSCSADWLAWSRSRSRTACTHCPHCARQPHAAYISPGRVLPVAIAACLSFRSVSALQRQIYTCVHPCPWTELAHMQMTRKCRYVHADVLILGDTVFHAVTWVIP